MSSVLRRIHGLFIALALGACGQDGPTQQPAGVTSSGGSGTSTTAGAAAGPAGASAGASSVRQPPPSGSAGTAAVPSSNAGRAAQGGSVGVAASAGQPAASGGPGASASGTGGSVAAGASAGEAAAGSGASAGAGGAGPAGADSAPILPPIDDPGASGPFDVRRVLTAEGLSSHGLFVPDKPGLEGKYPVVVWTCGNGGTVDFYASFLEHLASHGFLVVADKGSSSDRLAEVESQGDAIMWVQAQNDMQGGEFGGKLDLQRIAVMGHSLGSLASFGTAGKNMQIRTSVHYSGGLTGNPVGFDMAALKTMTKPAAFLCGGADSTAGPSCAMDFDQAPSALPVFYGVLQGASHIGPFGGTPRAGEYGRAGVAWLRWQLASDASFASWFRGADCTLCKSPWTAKQRNLD